MSNHTDSQSLVPISWDDQCKSRDELFAERRALWRRIEELEAERRILMDRLGRQAALAAEYGNRRHLLAEALRFYSDHLRKGRVDLVSTDAGRVAREALEREAWLP